MSRQFLAGPDDQLRALRQLEYLSPPLTVGQDARNRMLRSALARAFEADRRDG